MSRTRPASELQSILLQVIGSKIKIQDIVDEIVKEGQKEKRTKATYKCVYCTSALPLILERCGQLEARVQVQEVGRRVVGKPEMPGERQRQRFGWIC